jgi:hypothetical protein
MLMYPAGIYCWGGHTMLFPREPVEEVRDCGEAQEIFKHKVRGQKSKKNAEAPDAATSVL